MDKSLLDNKTMLHNWTIRVIVKYLRYQFDFYSLPLLRQNQLINTFTEKSAGPEDFIEKMFKFKNSVSLNVTTQHHLY